jgi:pimeloyl-ACP methyl ester carboxylesterase
VDEHVLWHQSGGSADGPLLVLLHGLGANAHVFDGVTAELARRGGWAWLVTDLAGHGRSAWRSPYSFDQHAADVADLLETGRPVVVLGHSMGGVVALELSSGRYGITVDGVVGLGIKVSWAEEELARAAALSERPPQHFPSRDEAVSRFLKVSGLAGLAPADAPVVGAGVRPGPDGWQLTMDPQGFGVGSPDMPRRMSSATCPVRLARGESDPMVSTEQLQALDPDAVTLMGLGHNAHVERPSAVLDLIDDLSTG